MIRNIYRPIFYKIEQYNNYKLLGTRINMLKIKKVNRAEFIADKKNKKEVFRWVAFLRPKNNNNKKIFDFKED